MRVAVVGASGFVGSAVVSALTGHEVTSVRAPRIRTCARSTNELVAESRAHPAILRLAEEFRNCDAVINAAGDPDPSSLDEHALFGANALVPRLILDAAVYAAVPRFVHVSSAVVQNDKPILDESDDMRPFSPYSASKVAGENALRVENGARIVVVRYRPPSVSCYKGRKARMTARLARSPIASVARPGTQPSPQALLSNVASAVVYLATCTAQPPAVVIHPWEGVTATGLMEDLSGGKVPFRVPRTLGRLVVGLAKGIGRLHRPTAANARRVELLWFGQGQSASWLDTQNVDLNLGREGWQRLGLEAQR